MRKHRTKAEWLSLIDEFEQSNQSQAEFCSARGLNPKYFSLRRIKLKAISPKDPFVEVRPTPADTTSVVIQYGTVKVHLPTTSTQAIVQLVKALAA